VECYHQDLKCQNTVRRESSGEVYFIDFAGGLTDGFYPPESEGNLEHRKVDARTGIYILGKTMWQLWSWKHPKTQDKLESFDIVGMQNLLQRHSTGSVSIEFLTMRARMIATRASTRAMATAMTAAIMKTRTT